jgi:hypothetical protein
MRFVRPEKKSIVAILVKRGVIFLGLMLMLTVFLYAVGTIQGFTDQTQALLLGLSLAEGLSLAAGSIYGIVFNVLFILRGGSYRLFWGTGAYIALGLFGVLITALSAFILALAGGNSP